jgi:hypothetical protein
MPLAKLFVAIATIVSCAAALLDAIYIADNLSERDNTGPEACYARYEFRGDRLSIRVRGSEVKQIDGVKHIGESLVIGIIDGTLSTDTPISWCGDKAEDCLVAYWNDDEKGVVRFQYKDDIWASTDKPRCTIYQRTIDEGSGHCGFACKWR